MRSESRKVRSDDRVFDGVAFVFLRWIPVWFFVDDDSGFLHVAELDDGKDRHRTLIVSYKVDQLVDWYDRAEAFLIDSSLPTGWDHYTGDDFGDWNEAINETRSGIERVQSD